MKHLASFVFPSVLICAVACSHVPESRDPAAIATSGCPTQNDPQCVPSSTGMITLDPPPPIEENRLVLEDAPAPREIVGRCELIVDGKPRPCTGVDLRVQRDGEERRAEVKGFEVRFVDLTRDHYRVQATHPRYSLVTSEKDDVSPGQTLKLTLRAKRR